MKATTPLKVAIASLALAAYGHANGIEDEYREHNVTIALKLSTEGEEKFEENNNGFKASQKIVTQKISNKQLLEALVEEGVIDSIKGWSIKALTSGSKIAGFFLVKKNHDPVDISEYFDYDVSFVLEQYKEKLKETDNVEKYENHYHILATGYFDLLIGDFSTETNCLVTVSGREYYKGQEVKVESESAEWIKKAAFEKIVGEAYEDDEPFGVIEGSVKAGEGKKTDLEEPNDD
jgi:hypothetical protein